MEKYIVKIGNYNRNGDLYCSDELWREYVACEEDWGSIVIEGNSEYQVINDCDEWKCANEILDEIDDYIINNCWRQRLKKEEIASYNYIIGTYVNVKAKKIDYKIFNKLIELYKKNDNDGIDDNITIMEIIKILFNKNYDEATIRGCSQGDWNNVYYDYAVWNDEMIRRLEAFYFGEMIEAIEIKDGEDFYCDYIMYDDISRCDTKEEYIFELQDIGILPDDANCKNTKIELFDGFVQVAKYKEVA